METEQMDISSPPLKALLKCQKQNLPKKKKSINTYQCGGKGRGRGKSHRFWNLEST